MIRRFSSFYFATLAIVAILPVPSPAASASFQPRPAIRQATPSKSQAEPTQDATPAPYEPDLLRLSEIIGALAYLRNLCGAEDGDSWRAEMSGLLSAQGSSEITREQLAGAYNKGFRDYELIYRACTPNARIVISRYLAEGAKLVRNVTAHYGGG